MVHRSPFNNLYLAVGGVYNMGRNITFKVVVPIIL